MKLVEQVHQVLAQYVRTGDCVIDATAGNGHDTACLARLVGPNGGVHAFDVQAAALAATRDRLVAAGLEQQVRMYQECHSNLKTLPIPPCRAAVFNLGYLPGADHAVTTCTETTATALTAAWSLLAKGGILSIVAYPGHPAGLIERDRVAAWIGTIPSDSGKLLRHSIPEARRRRPPEWFLLERNGDATAQITSVDR